jgi:hypothetical protein
MQSAIDLFRSNINYVHNLGAIYNFFKSQTTQALDISDILRAELVLAVSALDHYIHELVRIGMLEIYKGNRKTTDSYLRFNISLESAILGIGMPGNEQWLENEIRIKHSWRSFQNADKIADAVRIVSDIILWDEVSKIMGITPRDIKIRLNLIVSRRDKIAHEADIDPTFFGTRWPIDENMVEESIKFIEKVAETIFLLVK